MARISVISTAVVAPFYIGDVDRKQREIIHPPGQDRYVNQIDNDALQAKLTEVGSAILPAAVIAGTVTADDMSLANINAVVSDVVLTATQEQEFQDILSYGFIETGDFLLSFDRGKIKGMIDEGYIKVFPNDAAGLFVI